MSRIQKFAFIGVVAFLAWGFLAVDFQRVEAPLDEVVDEIFEVDVPSGVQEAGLAEEIGEARDAYESAYVLYTIDGDTIAVLVGSSTVPVRVRLIGVDTPETFYGAGDSGRKTCYGEEAKVFVRELLDKKSVTLIADSTQSDRDKYGRLLRYVFLGGENVSENIILEGYGIEYTFKGIAYEQQREFQAAEQKAQAEKRGLWGVCE